MPIVYFFYSNMSNFFTLERLIVMEKDIIQFLPAKKL